jgi:hypothetical protein
VYKTAPLFIHKLSAADVNLKKAQALFRVLAIGLALLHVYAAIQSQSMNADGISYLDIGDAYFRADWSNAINAVWSPLYSWILGLVMFLLRPSMQWEFPTVHIINFFIYVGALASFEFMWGKLRPSAFLDGERRTLRIEDWLWWALGYLLFIWISLGLIQIWSVTPDLLMAALVFLAGGLIAQIRSGDADIRNYLRLGIVLGLGYLAKTFMFAIAIVFLGLAWIVQDKAARSFHRPLLASAIFLVISLPFVLLISAKTGSVTIGEAGTVTFLRYVNGVPFPHWQGDADQGMVPFHPSRIIHEAPAIYEFGEPVGGTYPISTDPSYWYAGIEPKLDFAALLSRLLLSSLVYMELFLQKQGILTACVLALYLMGQRQRQGFAETLQRWGLVWSAIIAFGLYGAVLVEDRYVGVFVLLFWADILANVRISNTDSNRLWLRSLSVVAALGILINIAMFNLDGFGRLRSSMEISVAGQSAPPARPLAVAQALQNLGVRPGEQVGVIGYAYDSFWARLARVRIVAELLENDAEDLWYADDDHWRSVLRAFSDAGVSAVIAEYVPDDVRLDDWHRVENTNYYIYGFSE